MGKSVGEIIAGIFVGAATAATGPTHGDDVQNYVEATRARDESVSQEVSRSIDAESASYGQQSGQTK